MINIVKIEINDDSVLIFLQFMGLVYFVYRTLAVTIAEANTHLVVINGNFFSLFVQFSKQIYEKSGGVYVIMPHTNAHSFDETQYSAV